MSDTDYDLTRLHDALPHCGCKSISECANHGNPGNSSFKSGCLYYGKWDNPAVRTHIVGPCITIEVRWMRQRCSWCGETILDYDLTMTASCDGKGPGSWTEGAMVDVFGTNPVHTSLHTEEKLPDTFCGAHETFGDCR